MYQCVLKVKTLVGAGLTSVPVHSEEVGSSVDEFLSFVIKPGNLNSDLAIHNPHYRQQSRVRKGGTDITVVVQRTHFVLF